jgi:hypothetical protein
VDKLAALAIGFSPQESFEFCSLTSNPTTAPQNERRSG